MAVEDLDILREKLPELFDDKRINGEVILDSTVIPIEEEVDAVSREGSADDLNVWLDQMIEEGRGYASDNLIPLWPSDDRTPTRRRDPLATIARGEFPGKYRPPRPWKPGSPIPPLSPDSLAFYVPFHYSRDYWGIYVVLENYLVFCSTLYAQAKLHISNLAPASVRKTVNGFLYAHEQHHHKVECFATRLEVISRRPLYRKAFQKLYKQRASHRDSVEEALSTARGLQEAKERLNTDPPAQSVIENLLQAYVGGLAPEYQRALTLLDANDFDEAEQRFSEANYGLSFPSVARSKGQLPDIWKCFTFAYRGFSQINSPYSFIIPRNSRLLHRLPHSLRPLSMRDVRKRIGVLGRCTLLRQGSRHEIWKSDKTGKEVQIPRHPGDLKRGTLASIAKDACGMNLHEFMQAEI